MDPALPPKRRRSGLSLWLVLAGLILLAGGVYLQQHIQQARDKQAQLAREARLAAELAPPPPLSFFETVDFAGGSKLSFENSPERAGANALELASGAAQGVQEHFTEVASRANYPHLLIPVSLQGPRSRDRVNEYYAFRHREVDAYRRLTQDTGAALNASLTFLESYIKHVSEIPEAPTSDEVRTLGNAAIAAGSRDPLIRSYAAFFDRQATNDVAPLEAVLKETIPELFARKYPAIVQKFARMWAFAEMKLNGLAYERRWQPALVAIIRWLEEDSRDLALRTSLYWRLSRIWNTVPREKRGQIVTAMLESGPERIDPWLTHAFLGRYYQDVAWEKRGDGLADTVTADGWEGFRRNLALAATHLKYAWHLAPDMPQPAERMIGIAMADDDAESRPYEWFLRAVEAEFDYTEAYWSLNNALRPRWSGSHEEMFTFCRRCIETDQFDTQIPYLAINLLHNFEWMEPPLLEPKDQKLENFPVKPIVEQFATAMAAYRKSHPGAVLWGDSLRDRTNVLVFLERFGLHEAVLAEARALDGQFDASELYLKGRLGYYGWTRLAAAEQPDVRQRVFDFDKKLRTPWAVDTPASVLDELQAEYRALKDIIQPDDRLSTLFFAHAEKVIGQLRTFHETGAVTLDFDEQCSGWDISADRWEREEATGSLMMSRREGRATQLRARPLAQFAPPISVQADLTFLDPPPYPFSSGIEWYRTGVERHPLQSAEAIPYWSFEIRGAIQADRPRLVVVNLQNQLGRWGSEHLTTVDLRQHLEFRLWQQGYEGRIGDFTEIVEPRSLLEPEGFLAFGEIFELPKHQYPRLGAGALQLGPVRIQRLTSRSPPLAKTPLVDRARYWESRHAVDGPDSRAALELGNVRLEQLRLDEASEIVRGLEQSANPLLGTNSLKGRLLVAQKRYVEASQALELAGNEPGDDPVVLTAFGELLAAAPLPEVRDARNARGNAELAVSLIKDPENSGYAAAHAALAAAFAEQGEFTEAAAKNRTAIKHANDALKPLLEQRQLLYEADQPFRYPDRNP